MSTPDTIAALCRDVAVHCAEAVGDTGTEAIAALSSAGTALRAAAAALDAAAPARWEPGITNPRIATTVGHPDPAGWVQVSVDVYDHLMKLARRWAGYSDAGRAHARLRGPSPWLETDLDLLCAAMGVPLREGAARREGDDEIQAEMYRQGRRRHNVHVITRAWAALSEGMRNQVRGASPVLADYLSALVEDSEDSGD